MVGYGSEKTRTTRFFAGVRLCGGCCPRSSVLLYVPALCDFMAVSTHFYVKCFKEEHTNLMAVNLE